MRTRVVVTGLATMFLGSMVGGALFSPAPAGAVSREIVQLQDQVDQVLHGQQDLRSAMDQNNAMLKVMIQQTSDAVNGLSANMKELQKNVQEVQANSGSRIEALATQSQGTADNLQDVQSRVGKLSQQLTDIQNLLQSIDGKVSGSMPAAAPGGTPQGGGPGTAQPMSGGAPPSAVSSQTLYQNALRDFNGGKSDLARQEFGDYIKNFPSDDLASNAQFYLGEISYGQGDYQGAITEYDKVINNYPKSYKLAGAMLKKAQAYQELGQKATAARQYHEVIRRFPGTDEAHRADARLRQLAPAATTQRPG
ncbi:MAG: tol-pal system protein YbgF [Candidatus Acidiferrales bacterium]